MRISDWSSDVCSSDLPLVGDSVADVGELGADGLQDARQIDAGGTLRSDVLAQIIQGKVEHARHLRNLTQHALSQFLIGDPFCPQLQARQRRSLVMADGCEHARAVVKQRADADRSEEHPSELQSLMCISYAYLRWKPT